MPAGWHKYRIDEIGNVQSGRQRSPSAKGRMRKYLRVANVLDGFIDTSNILEMPFTDKEYERFLLKEGDILLNEGQSLELVGRSAIYKGKPENCCFQNTLIRFSPGELVHGRYAQHLFRFCLITGRFAAIASRTTSIAHLGVERFSSMVVPVPPLAEQEEISRVAEKWDRAIALTERLIAAKQERRTWLMQQLLTGRRRLPGFGGDWKEVEIGNLFREVNRPVEWDDDELYLLISVRRRSGGLFHRESLFGRQILTKNLKIARAGDFLISKMQVLHGATGMVTPEFDGMKISGSYISLVPRKPEIISTEFFNYYSQLPSFYHLTFLASFGVHIEKMTFDVKWFMKSKACVPPTIEEQDAIVKFLKGTDRELDLLLTQLDALREQKKGLMQQLLTGKIRVKVPC